MQKRRTSSSVLPVTESDAHALQNAKSNGHGRRDKAKRRPGGKTVMSDFYNLIKLLLSILAIGFCVVVLQMHFTKRTNRLAGMNVLKETYGGSAGLDDTVRVKPLQQFETLQYALDNSRLVALYFGAAWCPFCSPITELLDSKFSGVLLPPPADGATDKLPQRHGFSLVYVSSDTSAEEMQGNLQTNWMSIPYEHPDRSNLKREFATCAKREMEELGISERKREIPTIIVLSGESHQVLTYAGVEDVKEHGAQALDHWMELAVLNSALGTKFAQNEAAKIM